MRMAFFVNGESSMMNTKKSPGNETLPGFLITCYSSSSHYSLFTIDHSRFTPPPFPIPISKIPEMPWPR
jgi:hypothetical protein